MNMKTSKTVDYDNHNKVTNNDYIVFALAMSPLKKKQINRRDNCQIWFIFRGITASRVEYHEGDVIRTFISISGCVAHFFYLPQCAVYTSGAIYIAYSYQVH